MGQTLTHGIYLPDEGERNCYNGLAANWQLLDGAVGTVAEHTSQIAGKAPAVHTHTKSDITDFPVYGTTAGTICEGNDSRLSDARTPVAHTHTKSDVTDLLNSNFIPSANNSYDLGSSSYQWNNLYAKGYYYNGVAWGLDKNNEWTGLNTFSNASNCVFSFKFGSSGLYNDIRYYDSNNLHYACLRSKVNELTLGLKYSSASVWYNGASVTISNAGTVQIKSYDGTKNWTVNFAPVGVYPTSDKALELGTSTNKWKTLNGVNPGALSLPGAYQGINDQIKNPSDQLNAIDLNGGSNTWVSDVDCYLYFYIPNNKFTWIRIFWPATLVRCGQTFVPVPNESSDYSGFVPVPANTTVVIQIKGTQAPIFRRSACLGNV